LIYSNLEKINKAKGNEIGLKNLKNFSNLLENKNNENRNNNINESLSENSLCVKCGCKGEVSNCHKCSMIVCNKCSDICNNRKSNHVNKRFCNSCITICSLCDLNKNCNDCIKKCFSKYCDNLFCNICFDKNKHQVRKEESKCKFYRCENCNVDSNCIIRTLYCASCDKRACYKCLKKDHSGHINFK